MSLFLLRHLVIEETPPINTLQTQVRPIPGQNNKLTKILSVFDRSGVGLVVHDYAYSTVCIMRITRIEMIVGELKENKTQLKLLFLFFLPDC